MTTTNQKTAWLYCRKSSKEARGVDEDAKSVERQETNGRIDAGALGATVTELFKDDAISGAETRRLRDRQRMLALIRSGVKPDFLIMQKSDRLSRRDGAEAVVELREIARAGVKIRFYAKREWFTYGDFKSNIVTFTEAEFNAEFRRMITEKTTEAFLHKAKRGLVLGGRRFGYTNVEDDQPGDIVINEDERPVVVRIFELRAAGYGYTRIAKTLNAERAPSAEAEPRREAAGGLVTFDRASRAAQRALSRDAGSVQD
jgi:DNA invertase Pin-like site-specific DNA recombinase